MSSVILTGDTSGTLTLSAPLVAGSNTVTLPAATGTISLLTQATAVASTSGTSIDFTGIPSWAKRITVMFSGVSTSGTSIPIIQLGDSGGVEITSYTGTTGYATNAASSSVISQTVGFGLSGTITASTTLYLSAKLEKISTGNEWVFNCSGTLVGGTAAVISGGGSKTLSDVLTQIRITTVNGTDTFDAGTINIMYEG